MTNGPMILDGLQVGCAVFGETRRVSATVLVPGITATNKHLQQIKDIVTSNSHYVHNANLNEANLSISGSYGVSGLSQVKAGLSATVSREASQASNSLSISMQRLVCAGLEYIDLDNLKPEEFIAALKGAPDPDAGDKDPGTGHYNRMMRVLTAYHALIKPDDAEGAQSGPDEEALAEWALAKRAFFENAGELVVVGIVWGGWGGVELSFNAVTDETLWKAGGAGKFSYSGVGASVEVSASYGHTELSEDQKRSGQVSRISNGNCVEALVDKWETTLNDILLKKVDTIGETTVGNLGNATHPELPDAPDRVKPKASSGVADKIADVKDLDGLKALAKAQAYDRYVKSAKARGEDPMSLDDFMTQAQAENDLGGLDQEVDAVDFDNDHVDHLQGSDQTPEIAADKLVADAPAPAAEADPFSDFVAVGAWLVPWGQIFPWLAEPQHNAVPKGSFSSSLYRLRMLASDLETLERTYRHLDVMGVKIPKMDLDPGAIATSFKSLNARARDLLVDHLSEPGGKYDDKTLEAKMKGVLNKLAHKYRKIYSTWVKTPHLRRCELGAGMTIQWTGWKDEDGKHFVSPAGLKTSFEHKNDKIWTVTMDPSSFDGKVKNFEAFAKSVKTIPVILPSGDIVGFVTWTDENGKGAAGLLAAGDGFKRICYVSHTEFSGVGRNEHDDLPEGNAITFEPYHNALMAAVDAPIPRAKTTATMLLWPIPYSAANNVTWYGGGSSVGISDMAGNIRAMRERLAGLTQWSLGSEYWDHRDSKSPLLSLQTLKPIYVGLVEEPNLFNKTAG